MNRRRFLNAAAGAALWLGARRALGEEDAAGAALAAAVRRAVDARTPLLVVVVPENPAERHRRGDAWAELVRRGTDTGLAPFALTEIVCARTSEVASVFPDVSTEPVAILVRTSRLPVLVEPLEVRDPDDAHALARVVERAVVGDAALLSAIPALARIGREKLLGAGVPRALRPRPTGAGCCGADEDESGVCLGCGMASVSPAGRDFLRWLAFG